MKRPVLVYSVFFLLFATVLWASPPGATIDYQPMTSEGLAAGRPFEAWIVFDKSPDPVVQGYAFPAGATFRFTFASAFTPQPGPHPESVLLYDWPQKAAPVPFTIGLDPRDPLTVILKLTQALPAGPPERPGLKAIHLRFGPLNPTQPGDYPITLEIVDAGALSGTTKAVAHITPKPVPNVAAYNQLHDGRNEDWQRVKAGQTAPLPIDLLITLPDRCRSSVELRSAGTGSLDIMSDGVPIGTVTQRGVPVTFKPEPFGPGFARLGIVRFHVTSGSTSGLAEIDAQLKGGPLYTLHVVVEQ